MSDPFGEALTSQAQGSGNPDQFGTALIRHANGLDPTEQPSLSDKAIGAGEAALSGVTGSFASMAGGINYLGNLPRGSNAAAEAMRNSQEALTYQPRTAIGKEYAANLQNAASYLGQKGGDIAGSSVASGATKIGLPPEMAGELGATANVAMNIPQFLIGAKAGKAVGELERSMGEVPQTFADPQSMGAAHAPPNFTNADPDIQSAVSRLSPQEIEANRPVLERHAEAQSLPVKMRLTEGQATGDPDILSDEMNNRGATGLSKVLNDQGQQLKDNLQALREQVGPDVFTTNPVEHGQALIDAYKAKDAPIQADINAKYQALRDAAGGDIPIDGQAFVNNAKSALRKQLLSNDVPSSVKADLESFGNGEPMNFEDFESMRTKLAQEQRDNPSGNARRAAGTVRQALEDLPLKTDTSPGAEARSSILRNTDEEFRLPNLRGTMPDEYLPAATKNNAKTVTIYRGTPDNISDIRPGDWVALDKEYASKHGGSANVISKKVPADEVAWAGSDQNEFHYVPRNVPADVGKLKELADQARSAAKARFAALEADPAYEAAVNDKVPPDQFVNKFVTGTSGSATKGQAAIMRQNLSDNPTALQTMGVATVDELKKAALGPSGEGNFANVRYNNRLSGLQPKINDLLPADATEQARNLGNVARYIKQRPEGHTVSESNTLSGAIALKMGETAKSIANVKTGGLAGPVIDWAQTKLGERALKGKLETATAPLAGVKPRAPGPTLQ